VLGEGFSGRVWGSGIEGQDVGVWGDEVLVQVSGWMVES